MTPAKAYREVRLSNYERFQVAPIWAHRRWMEAVERGRRDNHGLASTEDGLEKHYWGMCGEMAYAKAHNLYFEPTVNTFKAPDLGDIQIRTRTKHSYELIVRADDADEEFFALVTVAKEAPAIFRVHGGMLGKEAKEHQEWLQGHGGRELAWFVPQWALKAR